MREKRGIGVGEMKAVVVMGWEADEGFLVFPRPCLVSSENGSNVRKCTQISHTGQFRSNDLNWICVAANSRGENLSRYQFPKKLSKTGQIGKASVTAVDWWEMEMVSRLLLLLS